MKIRSVTLVLTSAAIVIVCASVLSLAQSSRGNEQPLPRAASDLLKGEGRVCDSAALKDGLSGVEYLLASIDASGRDYCNELLRVDMRSGAILDRIDTWRVGPLADVIRDVDGDGVAELVVPSAISFYESGLSCIATIPKVLRCSSTCNDVSDGHANFYVTELNRRNNELMDRKQSMPDASPEALSCLSMEVNALRRKLKVDSNAGFDDAVTWMKSPDPSLRRKAAAVFEDIGGDRALQNLRILSADDDSVVATSARSAISRRSSQQPH